jgi:hypothetical protein
MQLPTFSRRMTAAASATDASASMVVGGVRMTSLKGTRVSNLMVCHPMPGPAPCMGVAGRGPENFPFLLCQGGIKEFFQKGKNEGKILP